MTQIARPAIDIIADIHDIIAHYPPLQSDRHQIRIDVSDGIATLSGYVRSVISHRYFADRVKQVRGVIGVNSQHLYAEETIRLEAGRHIPQGVLANASYGTVILTGEMPSEEELLKAVTEVGQIPGVERVVTQF